MFMIANVGNARALPRAPRSDDPMALLTVLGDPDRANEAKAYLSELNAVLAENIRVRDQAQAATAEANRCIAAANAAERKALDAQQQLQSETETSSEQLSAERAAVDSAYTALEERSEQLDKQQARIDDLTGSLRETAKHLMEWLDHD
jgi:septal ring factor EnvC (AmiA/AmiB activator)